MDETERQTPEKSRKNNEPQPHDGMKETVNVPDQARGDDQIIHESINFPDIQDDSKYNKLLNMTVEEFSKLPGEEQQELTKSYIEFNKELTKELRASLGRIAKQIADLYGTDIFQELDKKKKALQPYLREELKKPEYNGATPEDVFAYYNPFTGEPISMILEQPPEWWMEKHKITGQQALKAMEAASKARDYLSNYHFYGKPDKYLIINNPIINAMENLDQKDPIVGKKSVTPLSVLNGTEIPVLVSLTSDRDNTELHPHLAGSNKPGNISEFNRAVANAALSIYQQSIDRGNATAVFNEEMIYRALTGRTSKDRASRKILDDIHDVLELDGFQLMIDTDISAEAETRTKGKITELVYSDFLLPLMRIHAVVDGQPFKGYVFRKKPDMYDYSQLNKQYMTVSSDVLDIRDVKKDKEKGLVRLESKIPSTATRIAIVSYLLRRCEIMANDENKAKNSHYQYMKRFRKAKKEGEPKPLSSFRQQSRTILFEKIYLAAETDAHNSARVKDYVCIVLDNWQAMGRLKGYKLHKKKGALYSIDIEL